MTKFIWNKNNIKSIEKLLNKKEVIIASSDTVYGFLAATTEVSFNRLNSIKKRSNNPYLILTSSAKKALQLSNVNESDSHFIDSLSQMWPGPVTVILKAKVNLPAYMKSEKDTVAVRVPKHPGLQMLLEKIPYLFSTSANLTGKPIPIHEKDISSELLMQCAALVVDEVEKKSVLSSTIIDCTQLPCKIVRHGVLSESFLRKKLPLIFK